MSVTTTMKIFARS